MLDKNKFKESLSELGLEAEGFIDDITSASNAIYTPKLCEIKSIQPSELEGCHKTEITDEEKKFKLQTELSKNSIKPVLFEYVDIKQKCLDLFVSSLSDIMKSNKIELDLLKSELENIKYYWFTFVSDLFLYSFYSFLNKSYNSDFTEIQLPTQIYYSKISISINKTLIDIFKNIKTKTDTISKSERIIRTETEINSHKSNTKNIFVSISNKISILISDLISISDPTEYGDGFLSDLFKSNRNPTDEEIKNNSYLSNLESEFSSYITNSFCPILTKHIESLFSESLFFSSTEIFSNIQKNQKTYEDKLVDSYNKLISLYEKQSIEYQINIMNQKISNLSLCGNKLNIKLNTETLTQSNNQIEDTLSNGDISKLKYWIKYSSIINIQGLLPLYWSTGFYVLGAPLLLPITWFPLIVIPTQLGIIVVFLTVCGIAVSPVVWMLKMPPLGNSDSYFLVLFKSINELIKQETGSKSASLGVVSVPVPVDLNPELTRKSVMIKDDLPRIENVKVTNPLLLVYINNWLSVAKPYLGL